MKFVPLLALLATLPFVGNPAAAQAPNPALHVLFIGNSYTYYNDMPSLLSSLAAASGHAPVIETTRATLPGATLEALWNQGDARNAIRSRHWDFVVLQEQSVRPISEPGPMATAVRQFDTEIRATGARTILFLTWARRDYPATQAALNRAYASIGRELGADVAPVGPVWQRALSADPLLPLYVDDGSHPTPTGSYLAACVFYSTLVRAAGGCPQPDLQGISKHDEQVIAAAEAQMRNWHYEGR